MKKQSPGHHSISPGENPPISHEHSGENPPISHERSAKISRGKRPKKKPGVWSYLIPAVILTAGIGVMAYPTVSDWWNQFHQARTIIDYTRTVSEISDAEYDALYQAAEDYNTRARERANPYTPSESELYEYDRLLNIGGNGVMGYIDIPAISCTLPIFHGTQEEILQNAIGHIEWTSLPVGGESTHSVLSGHRGLPSAKLFTDLDRLEIGELFTLAILDEILTYEVDRILVVLPDETEPLLVEPGMDYCTLITCTPYGINTHRLLVRGHRVANVEKVQAVRVSADSSVVDPLFMTPFAAVPLLLVLPGWPLLIRQKKRLESDYRYAAGPDSP